MPFHCANSGTRINLHIQSHTYSTTAHTVSHIIPKKVTHCHGSHLAVMQLCIKQAQGNHGWRARIQAKRKRKTHVHPNCSLEPSYIFFTPHQLIERNKQLFTSRESPFVRLWIFHTFFYVHQNKHPYKPIPRGWDVPRFLLLCVGIKHEESCSLVDA